MTDKTRLEYLFESYLQASFDEMRVAYSQRDIDQDEAKALQKMLEERLGMKDPEGELPEPEAWVRSSWCLGG